MGGGSKAKAPKVPAPEPPPKPQSQVTNAFRQARAGAQRTTRGLRGTDITGGGGFLQNVLSQANLGRKTLLGG